MNGNICKKVIRQYIQEIVLSLPSILPFSFLSTFFICHTTRLAQFEIVLTDEGAISIIKILRLFLIPIWKTKFSAIKTTEKEKNNFVLFEVSVIIVSENTSNFQNLYNYSW